MGSSLLAIAKFITLTTLTPVLAPALLLVGGIGFTGVVMGDLWHDVMADWTGMHK